ncbi:D-alanine--D-alanine ligase family protein [Falsarthrobacter nasiphocae]|uniref:D-alanine--D-alanine ligase n=1 Tax=Falsarthrobacter nasiphocae TaxID=189863 RepID=A0AAE4C7T3_9MICC|nr:D-alanine--D-alanine ligase family protein [Falsarthrobacter nasiphocae]MDR6892839.1 D-alanine-D-alanine ligase [Falsarthrobacter nasiphocae]
MTQNPHESSQAGDRRTVLVLFGGVSSEHSVSCVSAVSVLRAIDRSRFDVLAVGITRSGEWTLVDAEGLDYSFAPGAPLPEVRPGEDRVAFSPVAGSRELLLMRDGAYSSLGVVDVVFPILHGPWGEDGTVQGLLELVGVPYAGAGVLTSAAGMDKDFMKRLFLGAGLEVGPYAVITDKAWRRDPEAAIAGLEGLEYPLFVKPARAGSSQGITRVEDAGGLRAAIEEARNHDPKVVVEQGIRGREIEVAVLGGRGTEPTRASLPGEIAVDEAGAHNFYDFAAKYIENDAARLSCPAEMPVEAVEAVRALAIEAFDALDGEGLSRVDFFLTEDGRFVINEINTMPGFTPISMYPALWGRTGLTYPELVSELLDLALSRPVGLR